MAECKITSDGIRYSPKKVATERTNTNMATKEAITVENSICNACDMSSRNDIARVWRPCLDAFLTASIGNPPRRGFGAGGRIRHTRRSRSRSHRRADLLRGRRRSPHHVREENELKATSNVISGAVSTTCLHEYPGARCGKGDRPDSVHRVTKRRWVNSGGNRERLVKA